MTAIVIPYSKLIFLEVTFISLSNQADKRFNIYIGDAAIPINPRGVIDIYKSPPVIRKNGV